VFFVEARYHHNPKRAADQVRYIAHREEGLRDGQRRELYGIGPRYRAFRGDERAIRNALVEDARGLRNLVYFRFILTVDNRTAERFARLDGRLAERVLLGSVDKTFRGAACGVQGVFAIHQHGGEDRAAHPHVHALLSPRFQDKSPTHLSPRAIQAVRERWEREVLRGLERQERRIEHARNERTPVEALTPYRAQDRVRQLPLMPAKAMTPIPPARNATERPIGQWSPRSFNRHSPHRYRPVAISSGSAFPRNACQSGSPSAFARAAARSLRSL